MAEKVELPDVPTDRKLTNKERTLMRYGTLCNDWTEYAKVAAESDKGKALADKYMRTLGNELKSMKLTESAKRKDKKGTIKTKKILLGWSLWAMRVKEVHRSISMSETLNALPLKVVLRRKGRSQGCI